MFRLIVLLLPFFLAVSASAADAPATYYRHAFAAIEADDAAKAESFATHGSDPVLNKVVRGYAMALPNNDYSFEALNAFIAANPNWPGLKGIQMIAEQKMPQTAASQVIDWFSEHAPVTLVGFYH